MRWAFWQRAEATPDGDAGRSAPDRDDADPAAELRARSRRRLVGAAVLLLAAVIVLPMLLDSTPRPVPDNVVITTAPAPASVKPIVERVPAEQAPAERAVPIQSASGLQPPVEPPAMAEAAAPEAAPKASKAAEAPVANAAEKFALQVAALSTSTAAAGLAARLKKAGFKAYVEAVATAEGTRHRVRVGPFASRDEAQRVADRLKAAGFSNALVGT